MNREIDFSNLQSVSASLDKEKSTDYPTNPRASYEILHNEAE